MAQAHNPIAAEFHYSEHCYQEHFVSVPLGLMLIHATNVCERDIVISNRHIVYCIVNDSLFYQLAAQILYFNTFITFLYMFRALLCSSSGGQLY